MEVRGAALPCHLSPRQVVFGEKAGGGCLRIKNERALLLVLSPILLLQEGTRRGVQEFQLSDMLNSHRVTLVPAA